MVHLLAGGMQRKGVAVMHYVTDHHVTECAHVRSGMQIDPLDVCIIPFADYVCTIMVSDKLFHVFVERSGTQVVWHNFF